MPKKENKKSTVSEAKKASLAKLVDLANKNATMMIISVEGISSLNFQQIKKALKKDSTIAVTKKSMMYRVIENMKKTRPEITALEKWIEKPSFAVIFSKLDPFELAVFLSGYKFPGKIKAGQISPIDVAIEAGPTDIPAGPMISELAAVGIKAGIVGGKISVKERKVLVLKGEKISAEAAAIMPKLEIVPFTIGPTPLAAYDNASNKVYEGIKIDKEAAISQLKILSSEAFTLSVSIAYPAKENIQFLLGKANNEINILSNSIK
jgi:large subunit ribosomal protein L10